jgi:hypothetical protein
MSTNYGDEITDIDSPAEVVSGVPAKFKVRFSAPQAGKLRIKSLDENLFEVSPPFIKVPFGEKQYAEIELTIIFSPNPPVPLRLEFGLRRVRSVVELKVKKS